MRYAGFATNCLGLQNWCGILHLAESGALRSDVYFLGVDSGPGNAFPGIFGKFSFKACSDP